MTRLNDKLWDFYGGLRLPGHKEESLTRPIQSLPVPARLTIPLQQHIGVETEPLVKVGDKVLKGQQIATTQASVAAPIHASSSGTVTAIENHPVPHPSGLSAPCIVIDTDGHDQWHDKIKQIRDTHETAAITDIHTITPAALRETIRDAGIVGLGGAAFPTHVKLDNAVEHEIQTLIINAAECEPYITCDNALMRERAPQIIDGIRILQHALQVKHCLLCVEDEVKDTHTALEQALASAQPVPGAEISLLKTPTRYPAGGEKQLIKTVTGKEVPANGLPSDIGVLCHNVGTAYAIYRAVCLGEPLISRIVTVTGQGITRPGNIEALIGTPLTELIDACGGFNPQTTASPLTIGGPMMGFPISRSEIPVTKSSNCLLVGVQTLNTQQHKPYPCIRCGACVDVCPAQLLPQQLYWHSKAREFDKAQDYNLFDCIECGCCAAVCPSHIPLVQYYRFAKDEIWATEKDRQKSERARKRFEFRQARIERQKRELEERRKRKKAALDRKTHAQPDPKKAAIQQAIERVQRKKAEQQVVPKNTEALTAAQQRQIEEAEKRRQKLKRATSTTNPDPES